MVCRIIPARAGFTRRCPGSSSSEPDHPRSRGVYQAIAWGAEPAPGSSPLARGLRGDGVEAEGGSRIIPARAGFTPGAWKPSGTRSDHPRSRGVYGGRRSAAFEVDGSSPLARGLHEWADRGQPVRGIIPARAGFTTCRRPGSRSRPDHPRSRGVYVSAFPPATAFRGSSPLARGLRDRPVMTGHEGGIIPARAGFTPGPVGQRHLRGDHPRSRGVYRNNGQAQQGGAGSSPLARGLLINWIESVPQRGIIPARAGFTRPPTWEFSRSSDHPRSRGVYLSGCRRPPTWEGSSPLARGLRQAHTRRLPRERIIPARAGFTPPGVSSRTSPRDHPRSRGVYVNADGDYVLRDGSSPLARGLQPTTVTSPAKPRIIPARAGFTRRGMAHADQ